MPIRSRESSLSLQESGIGSGATDHTDILGVLDQIVNAPSLEPFKDLTGEQFVREAVAGMKAYKLSEYMLQDYIASYAGKKFWDAMTFIRDYPTSLAMRLPEITVPCQLTVGRHDPFAPVSNARGLHKRLPKSKLDVIDCGHFVWEDAWEEYGRLACAFIQGGYAALRRRLQPFDEGRYHPHQVNLPITTDEDE
jgi:pimeloyl-ACP methyl ester carboxylesterase